MLIKRFFTVEELNKTGNVRWGWVGLFGITFSEFVNISMYRHFHALLGRQCFDNNVEIQISILYQVILVILNLSKYFQSKVIFELLK